MLDRTRPNPRLAIGPDQRACMTRGKRGAFSFATGATFHQALLEENFGAVALGRSRTGAL